MQVMCVCCMSPSTDVIVLEGDQTLGRTLAGFDARLVKVGIEVGFAMQRPTDALEDAMFTDTGGIGNANAQGRQDAARAAPVPRRKPRIVVGGIKRTSAGASVRVVSFEEVDEGVYQRAVPDLLNEGVLVRGESCFRTP